MPCCREKFLGEIERGRRDGLKNRYHRGTDVVVKLVLSNRGKMNAIVDQDISGSLGCPEPLRNPVSCFLKTEFRPGMRSLRGNDMHRAIPCDTPGLTFAETRHLVRLCIVAVIYVQKTGFRPGMRTLRAFRITHVGCILHRIDAFRITHVGCILHRIDAFRITHVGCILHRIDAFRITHVGCILHRIDAFRITHVGCILHRIDAFRITHVGCILRYTAELVFDAGCFKTSVGAFIGVLDVVGSLKRSENNNLDNNLYGRLFCTEYDVVFINIGGNDITTTSTPSEIVQTISEIVDDLYESGVKDVFIMSRGDFSKCLGLTKQWFDNQRFKINKKPANIYKEKLVRFGDTSLGDSEEDFDVDTEIQLLRPRTTDHIIDLRNILRPVTLSTAIVTFKVWVDFVSAGVGSWAQDRQYGDIGAHEEAVIACMTKTRTEIEEGRALQGNLEALLKVTADLAEEVAKRMEALEKIKFYSVQIHTTLYPKTIKDGNDITTTSTPSEIVQTISEIVDDLYESGVKDVFIMSRGDFSKCPGLTKQLFDNQRFKINKKPAKIYKEKLTSLGDSEEDFDVDTEIQLLRPRTNRLRCQRSIVTFKVWVDFVSAGVGSWAQDRQYGDMGARMSWTNFHQMKQELAQLEKEEKSLQKLKTEEKGENRLQEYEEEKDADEVINRHKEYEEVIKTATEKQRLILPYVSKEGLNKCTQSLQNANKILRETHSWETLCCIKCYINEKRHHPITPQVKFVIVNKAGLFNKARDQSPKAADLLKTHITGAICHGHGEMYSLLDIYQFPHDPNLTIDGS
ncbi:hypothetical protein MAR_002811 [Mya arenaria]|uniref:DUF7869 domain-containing protein n=1 Tax=Mya arenaria TaxID=6604 RepID=A0ABY7G7S2_MYAAR|nr:hypothetical protein MAR_002811 [Mya arenaria]